MTTIAPQHEQTAADERELRITPHESVAIRRDTAEELEVVATWAPGGSPPPAHYHPEQSEHFEVLEGELTVRVEGEERVLRAGDTLDVPPRAVHQMWNPGDVPARALWRTMPGGRTGEWFRRIDGLHRAGKVGRNGMPGPLLFAALLTEYDDVFRLAARPERLARLALAALAVAGRRRLGS